MADRITAALAATVIDAAPQLASIKLVKDSDEVAKVAHAYRLALAAQTAVGEASRAGVSEIELFTVGQAAAQRLASEPIAFAGDLLIGLRTSRVCAPVAVAGPTPLRDAEAVVSDLVVGYRGYWGDTAETYLVGANSEIEQARETLLASLGPRPAGSSPEGRRSQFTGR